MTITAKTIADLQIEIAEKYNAQTTELINVRDNAANEEIKNLAQYTIDKITEEYTFVHERLNQLLLKL